MSTLDSLTATANRLLTTYGQSMSLGVFFSGAYDPTTGTSSQTQVDHPVIGYVKSGPRRDQNGTLIKADSMDVYIAMQGLDVTPDTTMKLTIASIVYTVASVDSYQINGTPAMYVLGVER